MKYVGTILALVITTALIGAGPASANQSASSDTISVSASQPADPMVIGCTRGTPPSGWYIDTWFGGGWTAGCNRCLEAGRRLEASGRFRAWCHLHPNRKIVVLYTFCVVCLSDVGSTPPPARLSILESSAS
jgi:hypothetical protein